MRLEQVPIVNAFVSVFDFLGFKALRRQKTTAGLFHLFVSGLLPSIVSLLTALFHQLAPYSGGMLFPDFISLFAFYHVLESKHIKQCNHAL